MSILQSSEKSIKTRSRIRELIAERKTRMIDGNNIQAHRLTLDEIKNIREENKKSIEERYKIIENEKSYLNYRRERREQKRLERLEQQQQQQQQQQQMQLQEPNDEQVNVEETYSQIDKVDLVNSGLKFGFRPQPELIQTHNMKVTHISSMLDSQIVDFSGQIFHISDHLYGMGTNKSILFWDKSSFIRTTLSSPSTNPCELFHLKLNIKIPSFHNVNEPLNCFQHSSMQNKNILQVTYNNDNFVITFYDNIMRLEHFSRGGVSSYDVEIKCIYSESNYVCSCEMKQDDDVQHRIEKEFRMDNVFMKDESFIEIGKGVMFLRNIEYYIS
jgi:hypothetical protein